VKKFLFKYLAQWGLALLLVICLFLLGDVSQLMRQTEIDWGFAFLALLSGLGFTLAHNFRWKEIVDHLSGQRKTDFFSLFRSLVNSYAMGKIVPMDVSLLGMRSYYLNRFQNMPVSTAIFSVLLDRFLDLLLFLTMVLPAFLFISKLASATEVALIFLLLVLVQGVVIHWKKGETFSFFLWAYRTCLVRWCSRLPLLGDRIRAWTEVEERVYPFHFPSVLRIMIWNHIKYFFLCLRFFFTGLTLGVHFPLINAFLFPPFIQLGMLINVTPGGLGVVEMGTYGALLLMGISKSQILVFVVGQRILLFAIFLIIFILSHLFFFIQSRWTSQRMR
jgi:uncharacterized protein (TIRG00374 family)